MVATATTFLNASSAAPAPFRGAGKALAAAARAGSGQAPQTIDGPELARTLEGSLRRLRANAHAAFHSVEGAEDAALDAALAVVESEWLATRAQRDSYAEALKTIRLYGGDPDIRALAGQVLR